MIIKFTHGISKETETWEVLSNFERFSFTPHTAGMISSDGLDFTDSQNQNKKWDIKLFKENGNMIELSAQSPIFVVENGKTIDKF